MIQLYNFIKRLRYDYGQCWLILVKMGVLKETDDGEKYIDLDVLTSIFLDTELTTEMISNILYYSIGARDIKATENGKWVKLIYMKEENAYFIEDE